MPFVDNLVEEKDEVELNKHNWAPTASLAALQARAQMYAQVRSFFAARGCWRWRHRICVRDQ